VAWDNVCFESPTLGYVVANHQTGPNLTHEPLAFYSAYLDKMTMWLAESYQYSPDYMSLTIKTRPEAMWSDGVPFTAAGFGNWFRDLCDKAGCPDVSAHGLRKATARRLAEIGCTEHEIASITGHASLKEVERYTKAANRKRLARSAMKKLIEGGW
jgi:ABC-type transport system substrate-binding protein